MILGSEVVNMCTMQLMSLTSPIVLWKMLQQHADELDGSPL